MDGVFGICSQGDCLEDLYGGTFRLQHRGQEYCGLSTFDGKDIKLRTHRGLVVLSFEDDLPGLQGYAGIGHTSSGNRQPVLRCTRHGRFTLGFDGYIINSHELTQQLFKQGHSFSTGEDVELLASLIAKGKNMAAGIDTALKKVKGPCSLVLLNKEGVYAARDSQGLKPLVLGRGQGKWAVASESCAFGAETGIERVRDVEPGEIVLLNKEDVFTIKKGGNKRKKVCSFEWIYYARPDSSPEAVSVVDVRHNLGRFLAEDDDVDADVVGPVPFSGILHAEGYHLQSGISSVEVFLLPQYLKRTYIMPLGPRKTEKERKLTPLKQNVCGKRVVLVDDSIRSGITIRGLVALLKGAGAKEVHVRIASPPSTRSCPFDKPPLEEEDFIANGRTVPEIQEFIGADSLRFQKLENVARAITEPEESLCLDCFL
jgi:amidophosphoribosyltransferase